MGNLLQNSQEITLAYIILGIVIGGLLILFSRLIAKLLRRKPEEGEKRYKFGFHPKDKE